MIFFIIGPQDKFRINAFSLTHLPHCSEYHVPVLFASRISLTFIHLQMRAQSLITRVALHTFTLHKK